MKKLFDKSQHHKLQDLWRERFHSHLNKLSCGAAQIARVMTSAHKNQWRRKDKSQHTHDMHPGHKFHKDK